jgi:pimeloyl-ACP methyl ester carboxylesterase
LEVQAVLLLTNPRTATGGVVKVSGHREIHDVIIGDGPITLLMLHGLGGDHRAYPWVPKLARRLNARVLFPWLICHGPSCDVDTFDEAVDVMGQYREQRGADDCLVIGHSKGGALATALTADRGRSVAMAAPIDPRFVNMSELEMRARLGWVGMDLLACMATGVMESMLRLDFHRFGANTVGALTAGHRIDLGIRVLRSMPDLTPQIRRAYDAGRPQLRLWGLADIGVQRPRLGSLPGADWLLPGVRHADFAFHTIYPYWVIRMAAEVQLGLAKSPALPVITRSAA